MPIGQYQFPGNVFELVRLIFIISVIFDFVELIWDQELAQNKDEQVESAEEEHEVLVMKVLEQEAAKEGADGEPEACGDFNVANVFNYRVAEHTGDDCVCSEL